MNLYDKHAMRADTSRNEPYGEREQGYINGFNHALKLADAANESAIHALKRSFYEADAIARGTNTNFVCAPVIRDYCKTALADLGVSI